MYALNKSQSKSDGFTLIELMIVVVIVGIIAAIGYPQYGQYVLRAGRAEGAAALLSLMERQEVHYRDQLSYATVLTNLGYPNTTLASETGRYQLTAGTCASGTINRCVLLVATPTPGGKQAADNTGANSDGVLTLNSRGAKSNNWPQ